MKTMLILVTLMEFLLDHMVMEKLIENNVI
jgi:hypothetical protein